MPRSTSTATDVNGDGRTAAHDPPRSDRNKNLDELQARINICNEAGADLLVSMHVNGYSNGDPRGYETWFTREREFGDRNAVFATLAYAHLKEQLGYIGYVLPAEEERGVLPDTTADVQKELLPVPPLHHDRAGGPGRHRAKRDAGGDRGGAVRLERWRCRGPGSPEGRNAIVTAYENAIVDYFVDYYPPEADQAATPVAPSGD